MRIIANDFINEIVSSNNKYRLLATNYLTIFNLAKYNSSIDSPELYIKSEVNNQYLRNVLEGIRDAYHLSEQDLEIWIDQQAASYPLSGTSINIGIPSPKQNQIEAEPGTSPDMNEKKLYPILPSKNTDDPQQPSAPHLAIVQHHESSNLLNLSLFSSSGKADILDHDLKQLEERFAVLKSKKNPCEVESEPVSEDKLQVNVELTSKLAMC